MECLIVFLALATFAAILHLYARIRICKILNSIRKDIREDDKIINKLK